VQLDVKINSAMMTGSEKSPYLSSCTIYPECPPTGFTVPCVVGARPKLDLADYARGGGDMSLLLPDLLAILTTLAGK
jgi:hypothetical protein